MASLQCCEPTEKACNQGHRDSSLGQKVSEVASWAYKSSSETKNHGTQHTTEQTQCYSETQGYYTEQGVAKTQTTLCQSQTKTHNPNQCMDQNKKRGEHKKKGLFQRIKDGISGDSSSSDSESDDEDCGKRKN